MSDHYPYLDNKMMVNIRAMAWPIALLQKAEKQAAGNANKFGLIYQMFDSFTEDNFSYLKTPEVIV